jgi:hypothetical protein
MQSEMTGRRVDNLRRIMAGPPERLTIEAREDQERVAKDALDALDEFIDSMAALTSRESSEALRMEYGRIWSDAIIVSGDLRRASGLTITERGI